MGDIGGDRGVEVAVATVDGKAYYTLTRMLKGMGIPFINLSPRERIGGGVKLVLTTRKERPLIQHRGVLCLEELGEDLAVAKERLFRHLYQEGEDLLVVGIDPGVRIGVVAYFLEREIYEGVFSSIKEAVNRISDLLQHSSSKRRVVRIGDGKPGITRELVQQLLKRVEGRVEVELVDESGTSSLAGGSNKRGMRDLRSARMIAFRQGRRYSAGIE